MVRFLRIDPKVRGSNPPSAKLNLELGRSLAFCDSRRRDNEVWSNREEGPGYCSIINKLLSIRMSAFDNIV